MPEVSPDDQPITREEVPPRDAASGEPVDREAAQVRDRLRARLFGIASEPVKIGPYTLLSRIGAGGMGVVYAAHDPTLDRTVALKLLRPADAERDGGEHRTRLLREAKALAKLSHPNVVAVYEVGALGDGVWLAMEYIDGVTLRTWLGERPRRWPEKLRMLLAVGHGLAAAHAAGLVHRDFKPDNVMIGRDGRPRVMDFGLARVAGPRDDSERLGTLTSGVSSGVTTGADVSVGASGPGSGRGDLRIRITRTGALLGTPAYMAPEQLRREAADPRADQFAFCVTLWEALLGERPFRGGTLAELIDSVLAGEITPPRRRAAPRWLLQALRRGLNSRPERRFESMDALLTTLERGRVRVWTRRIAVVVGLAVIAGAVAVARTNYEHNRRIAGCEAAGAQIAAVWNDDSKARLRDALVATGASYAATSYERAAPWIDRWTQEWSQLRTRVCHEAEIDRTRTPALYERASACLDERRDELVALLAALDEPDKTAVQRVVAAAAGLSQLAPCADQAALERRPALPDDADLRAQIVALRRDLSRVQGLGATGRFPAALELAEATLAAAIPLRHPPLLAEANAATGRAATQAGKYDRAEQTLTAAFTGAAAIGAQELATRAAISLVHVVGDKLTRPAEGRIWAHVADAQVQALGQRETLLEASLLQTLANLRGLQGAADEAISLAEHGLAIRMRELGPDHPDVGRALNDMANDLARRGDHANALTRHQRALEIWRRTQSPDHPLIAFALGNLATLHSQTGAHHLAAPMFEEALQIGERALGPDHAFIAHLLGSLAVLRADHEHDYRAALALQERALQIQLAATGEEHAAVALSLCNLADFHRALAEPDKARPLYRRAIGIWERTLGEQQPRISYALVGLGELALTEQRPAEALPLLERAVKLQAGGAPTDLAEAQFALARALWSADDGEHARALQVASAAAESYRAAGSVRPPELAAVESWLAAHGGPGPQVPTKK